MSVKIGVIVGSTRPGRSGEQVKNWFMEHAQNSDEVQFELLDLLEWDFPIYNESVPASAGKYEHPHTKKWAATVGALDGFIVITPEYNHSFPAALKNALDYIYAEWHRKPIGFVSYGGLAGGARAVEQLRLIAVELHMVPVREQILIPTIWEAVDGNTIKPEYVKGKPETLITDVLWWAEVLKTARAKSA